MFQPGDRIEVWSGSAGKKVTATILELQYRNGTNIAKVRREDNGQEDVFAWNIYQDEISVKMATPEPMVTMTQRELDLRIAQAFAMGEKKANDIAYQNGYGPKEE